MEIPGSEGSCISQFQSYQGPTERRILLYTLDGILLTLKGKDIKKVCCRGVCYDEALLYIYNMYIITQNTKSIF